MPSTLLQLHALGDQDVYLTSNPQINVFKYSYYRYANFAAEVVKLFINQSPDFGRQHNCIIPRRGQLLSKLYLHIKLPKLTKTSGEYLCWTDAIGYAIFDGPIELEINGVIVDRLYPQFLNIWDELKNNSVDKGKNLMLLKSDVYTSSYDNAIQSGDLVIPLDFWFTKSYNLALPLISLYNAGRIQINFKFRDFLDLVNYDGNDPAPQNIIEGSVFAEYIYLDDSLLPQFSNKQTYLIEQIQYNSDDMILANMTSLNVNLNFNNAVKELVVAFVEQQQIKNNNYFVYSKQDGTPILSEMALMIEGQYRFDYLPEVYYRTVVPHAVHSNVPLKYVYSIPFALRPEDNQPTGTINMSRFDNPVLSLKIQKDVNTLFAYVFAISYNILVIENGMMYFLFNS